MKKRLLLLLILIIFSLCIWYYRTETSSSFTYAGTVEVTKVTLSSRLSANILSLKLEEGDFVNEGETIVQLDDDAYKIASKQIDRDYERSVKLMEKGHTSAEQHDRIERAKRENDLHIKWCDIKSPISGTIITKFKEEGEFVSPGTPIISIADTNNMWAYFYVEHNRINKINVGNEVKCRLPERPDKEFVGKVIKINEEAEFTPKNVQTREERTRLVYGVKVKFNNNDKILKSGMTLETLFE